MKNLINKFTLLAVVAGMVTMTSCFKEHAIEPVADFTTNLTENTAYAGESFYIYLDKTQGDFLTLFSGLTEEKTYSPDNPAAVGVNLSTSIDSFEVTLYNNMGNYRMTLVASSVGEFGDEYLQDTFGIDLTVLDGRTGFVSFSIDKVEGQYNDDGTEIYFYTFKDDDISAKKPAFIPSSPLGVVTIDGVVQETQKSVVDFSPLNAGDDEGRPVVYRVTAPNGDYSEFTVKYILRASKTEKQLLSLTCLAWNNAKFVVSPQDEAAKQIKVFQPSGGALTGIKMQADALAYEVYIGDVMILGDDDRVDIQNNNVVTVVAEDGSTQDYDILIYSAESIDTFNLVQAGGMELNPSVEGVIEDNTITLKVLDGTDLTNMVAEFSGPTTTVVKLDGTEIISGVTEADYSGSPVLTLEAADGTVINTYNIVVDVLSK